MYRKIIDYRFDDDERMKEKIKEIIKARPYGVGEKEIIKLELTKQEMEDLYDMFYMINPKIIKENNCQESFDSIFKKVEKIVIPEILKNG